MSNIEQDLKIIKAEMHGHRFFLENETSLPEISIRRLSAMDLISLRPFADGMMRIDLTPTGEFYDDFKKQRQHDLLVLGAKEVAVSVISVTAGLLIGLVI